MCLQNDISVTSYTVILTYYWYLNYSDGDFEVSICCTDGVKYGTEEWTKVPNFTRIDAKGIGPPKLKILLNFRILMPRRGVPLHDSKKICSITY